MKSSDPFQGLRSSTLRSTEKDQIYQTRLRRGCAKALNPTTAGWRLVGYWLLVDPRYILFFGSLKLNSFTPMASILPGIRRAAPRLARDFFVCHQCIRQSPSMLRQVRIPQKLKLTRNVRFNSTISSEGAINTSSPLSSLSQTISRTEEKVARQKFFPETSSKVVAYWLLGSAASVFGIVVFGGLTRLTESGYVCPRERWMSKRTVDVQMNPAAAQY